MAFEDERAADEGWPTVEAEAGAMMRAGEVADIRLVADFCRAYAEASRKAADRG
jgi:delta 1-pyrroline-5-carboxylate dehydrogenase